ncbi:MAG TPA: IS1182 family transposase [bacterium]|nr:IS1182 family transposase [bacterium]
MPKYKDYKQGQESSLFPINISELISENHLVRQIDSVIERISMESFNCIFSDKGASSYHPKMMLKVIIYGYSTKNFSSRNIAAMLRQDVTYMWLSGMQQPDFNTINRFRSVYLKEVLEDVFTQVLLFLHEHEYIDFENYFVDGTKIEADAGKYTHVWKKNTYRYKASAQERVKTLLKEIDKLNTEEDLRFGDADLPQFGDHSQISSDEVRNVANRINETLINKEQDIPKKSARSLKSKVKKLKEESEKIEKYENQQNQLANRNSYSKTDPGATMMRMKGSDELRPGYNWQVSSENQFITNFSVSQNAADVADFPDHLEKIVQRGEHFIPENYIGDAGYGSEENYEALEEKKINHYMKYSTYHTEQSKKHKTNIFHKDNMFYDPDNDCYICPYNRKLVYRETVEHYTQNGYKRLMRRYECENCQGCPFQSECIKSKGNRTIHVSVKWEKYKKQAKLNLESEKGWELREKRGWEIETFFGDLKHNLGYTRCRLRGIEKSNIELAWLSISYNLRKLNQKRLNLQVNQKN